MPKHFLGIDSTVGTHMKFIVDTQEAQSRIMSSLWLIALSIGSGVIGQTVIKIGVNAPGASEATSSPLTLIGMILRSPWVLVGLVLYGAGALAWIAVLGRLDLSYAYPFLALNFVFITLISRLVLGETIPWQRWLGILVICIGILLVARSGAIE
jgi:drug/metabolite transporter (DMT)-like permease